MYEDASMLLFLQGPVSRTRSDPPPLEGVWFLEGVSPEEYVC